MMASELPLVSIAAFIGPILTLLVGWVLGKRKQDVDINVSMGTAYQGLVSASGETVDTMAELMGRLRADLLETKAELAELHTQNAQLIKDNERLTVEIEELRGVMNSYGFPQRWDGEERRQEPDTE